MVGYLNVYYDMGGTSFDNVQILLVVPIEKPYTEPKEGPISQVIDVFAVTRKTNQNFYETLRRTLPPDRYNEFVHWGLRTLDIYDARHDIPEKILQEAIDNGYAVFERSN